MPSNVTSKIGVGNEAAPIIRKTKAQELQEKRAQEKKAGLNAPPLGFNNLSSSFK